MASWGEILNTVHTKEKGIDLMKLDKMRMQYLSDLATYRKRNVIAYYSGWMYRPGAEDVTINDKDMNAFMEVVHRLDKTKGLDLILHTPGGEIAATEQIINYLHSCFEDITVIIPQMAMSAGSMIAVSCKSIIIGKQSCLGPFDPQLNGAPCQSVVREFYKAVHDIEEHPASLGLWQTIISKLTPTFISQCEQADELATELTEMILSDKGFDEPTRGKIREVFSQNSSSKIHNRHIDRDKCRDAGLDIIDLEDDQVLQDLVLGIHHCCMILSEQSNILKVVENNIGGGYVVNMPIQPPIPGPLRLGK